MRDSAAVIESDRCPEGFEDLQQAPDDPTIVLCGELSTPGPVAMNECGSLGSIQIALVKLVPISWPSSI